MTTQQTTEIPVCQTCNKPMEMGKFGFWCKPCWKVKKDKEGTTNGSKSPRDKKSITILAILKGAFDNNGMFNADGAETALKWYKQKMASVPRPNKPAQPTEHPTTAGEGNNDAEEIVVEDLPF